MFLSLVAVVLLACSPAALCNQLHIVSSSDSEIVVELVTDEYAIDSVAHGGEQYSSLSVRGYGHTDRQGLPRVPTKGALIGVPFGTHVSLNVVSVVSTPLGVHRVEPAPIQSVVRDSIFVIPIEEYVPDDRYYSRGATYPASVAEMGFDSVLRHQRVVQILFHPFQYNPGSDQLTLHERIVVKLHLGESRRPVAIMPVATEEREWEGLYSGTVLNYREAKRWRMRPEPQRALVRHDMRREHEVYKLTIEKSGIHSVSYAELHDAGFDQSLAIDEIGIYQRAYDEDELDPFLVTPVGTVVADVDDDGSFGGSDYVVFFAQSFEQQFMPIGYEDRYTRENAYWFGWGDGVVSSMSERSGWHGQGGLVAPVSFRDTLRFEEDVYFDRTPPGGFVDMWHWTAYFEKQNPPYGSYDDFALPFAIYDIHGEGDVLLKARYQGMKSGTHEYDFSIIDGLSQEHDIGHYEFSGFSTTMGEHMYESPSPIPSAYFTDGENEFRANGYLGPGETSGANLDWFEFSYQRSFMARQGRLEFTNALETGLVEFEIEGFESDTLHLFDVTDPLSGVSIALDSQNIQPEGDLFTLVFQDSVASFTRYEAVEEGSFLSPSRIERRDPANLFASEADYIVISYEGFASGVEPLIAKRTQQGFVVAHAQVGEVYDEFGGGIPSPHAIKDYLEYAFGEWIRQPQFALLVGDASEDPRGLDPESDPDFVSTYMYAGSTFSEIRTSDEWYVCFQDEDPFLPQMYIGRLPVGGTGELAMEVSKILAYGNYSPDDEWRNNILLAADDAWKYYLGGEYCRYPGEDRFSQVTLDFADIVASSPAEVDTTVFLLKRYTEPFHEDQGHGNCASLWDTYDFVDEEVTPDLIELLSEGAIIFNFQGHANRDVITHEALLENPSPPFVSDFDFIVNGGKPFIFLGFACALSEFALFSENKSGDCFSEDLLHISADRGAVATFASTGIEWLDPNATYNEKIFEAFFTDPAPEGPPEEYFWPRWSLGGILAKATVKLLTDTSWTSPARSFVLFGDPLMRIEMTPPTMQVTVDGETYHSGDYLDVASLGPGDAVQIVADIIDEVEIPRSNISILQVSGTDTVEISPDDYTLDAISDTTAQAHQSRWYRLTYNAILEPMDYAIKISAEDANGQETGFAIRVQLDPGVEPEFAIEDVANHPNPFTGTTKIIYFLTQSGADVTVRIYTVGGRLIRVEKNAPNGLNYNEWEWDGTDEQGDGVANGVYLLFIEATNDSEETVSSGLWKMLRAR